jgi:hypothetical protein
MRSTSFRVGLALVLVLVVAQSVIAAGQGAPAAAAPPAFGPQWKALIGDWAGDGGGQPGAATGRTSYRFEVGEHAIIRRNRADVAAGAGRPASVHEDLLVIFAGDKPGEARAVYIDNEDHVIHYTAAWSADGKTLTFVSDATPAAPRFKMTYTIQSADSHVLDFAIAPPGSPEGFKLYVSGTLKRLTPTR